MRQYPSDRRSFFALVLLLFLVAPTSADPGIEFFEKKVRPVLVEHCYRCHASNTKQRGGLALDTRESTLKGGDTGPALVTGKPSASLLVKAVRYQGDLKMPPKGKLPDDAVADLIRWIEMGAPDPRSAAVIAKKGGIDIEAGRKFWAFQPPKKSGPPTVQNEAWPLGDIDRFLQAKREARKLRPVADADRVTLIRRLSYDLVGLPPTPEEIDAFVNDASADAYEKLVDRLLASPHYGERWGRHWLDVARFAESSGGGRSLLFRDAWRYRDYVIKAFNQDRPYDRFVREQIAGDLLPAETPEQRHDGLVATGFLVLGPTNYEGQDKDLLEMDVIDEQLDTMGRALLGMTIGCARCHDHKFDPIPTKDYYALAGIFKSTQTLIHDNVSRWVDRQLPMSAELETVVKKHDAAVVVLKEKVRLAKEAEKKAGKEPTVVGKGPVKVSELSGIVLDDSKAKQVGAWTHSKFSGNFIGDGYLHDGNADKGSKTLTFVPEIPKAGKYEVRLAYVPGTNRATKVPVTVLHVDGEFETHVNMQDAPAIDGRFVSLGTFRFSPNGQWFVLISNEDTKGHVVVDAVQFLAVEDDKNTTDASEKASEKPTAVDVKKLEAELKKLTDAAPDRPLAMSVLEAAKIENCPIAIRGNIHNKGEVAPRGFLQVATRGPVPSIPVKESGRRELAVWLTTPDNPLTARVMANRVWHWLFGVGLVRTVDEFGVTGEAPSHPELLDHLAIRFVEDGWSVKKLVRSIVLSRTYRLSNASQQEGLTADPENRLLWRQNRRRLEAEEIRDTILSVSGKLDRSVGGPNIKKGTSSEYGYVYEDVRRSVYTPVFRNRLLELFEAFDFPDPNLVGGRRNVSTVPTQALYLLNNPFMMEQAKHAARAALAAPGLDDAGRIERAYRASLGRVPTAREKEIVLEDVSGKMNAEQLAAWARLYQALFASIDFRYVN